MIGRNIQFRRHLMNTVGNCLRHSSCNTVSSSRSGCSVVKTGIVLKISKLNSVGLENTHQFLKGNNEVHIAANICAHRFQFFRRARTDEYHPCIRMLFFNNSRGCYHRSHRVGNTVCNFRELLFCHHNPGRTAGSRQERQLSGRHIFNIFLRFFHSADVRAAGNLVNMFKADFTQCCAYLFRRSQRTELTDKCRSYLCDDLISAFDCLNQLKNL